MFAQANSEHCRHKIFNADWIIDGEAQPRSPVRDDPQHAPSSRPAACCRPTRTTPRSSRAGPGRFCPAGTGVYAHDAEPVHILMKVETHNHPTAIAPFPARPPAPAARSATRAPPAAAPSPRPGLCGFSVSNLRIPGFEQPWEGQDFGRPGRIVSALDIMLEGPIGGAAFNNEFGRPNLCGYFRTFEQQVRARASVSEPDGRARRTARLPQADHARRRLGNIRAGARREARLPGRHAAGRARRPGDADRPRRRCRVEHGQRASAGGPRFRLGAARQPGDGAALPGGHRPLLGSAARTTRSCSSTTSAPAACPMRCRSWCTTATRAAAALRAARVPSDDPACRRWRSGATRRRSATCWPSTGAARRVRGHLRARALPRRRGRRGHRESRAACLADRKFGDAPSTCPCRCCSASRRDARDVERRRRAAAALGPRDRPRRRPGARAASADGGGQDLPDHHRRSQRHRPGGPRPDGRPLAGAGGRLRGDPDRLRRLPPARPWPWASARRLALLDAPASGRMAVAEAITNIAAAPIARLGDIKLSANWMAAAGSPGEDARALRHGARRGHGAVPGARHRDPGGQGLDEHEDRLAAGAGTASEREMTAPLSLIVSAFAPVADVQLAR
jgi:phosphoribosylformylglycinamidine synthase